MPENVEIRILGGVLAGGQSRRMDGREKSLLVLDGDSLVNRIVRRLALQVEDVVINASGDPSRFAPNSNNVISDIIENHAGPLAGIHALMDYAINSPKSYTHLASVAADTPFFPPSFVEKIASVIRDQDTQTIVIAKSGGYNHPVFGLWPISLFTSLDAFLRLGETRKVMAFVKQHRHKFAEFEFVGENEQKTDPFFNINTPLDMEKACAIISTMELNNDDD